MFLKAKQNCIKGSQAVLRTPGWISELALETLQQGCSKLLQDLGRHTGATGGYWHLMGSAIGFTWYWILLLDSVLEASRTDI